MTASRCVRSDRLPVLRAAAAVALLACSGGITWWVAVRKGMRLGGLDQQSVLHWAFLGFLLLGGLYAIGTAVRWVLRPGTRQPRFRDFATLPVGDKIFFVAVVVAYMVVGMIVTGMALATSAPTFFP